MHTVMNPELKCDRSNATEFSRMCLSDAPPPQCYSVAFYELRQAFPHGTQLNFVTNPNFMQSPTPYSLERQIVFYNNSHIKIWNRAFFC